MIPVIVLNLVSSTGRRAKIGAALASLGIAHRFLDGRRFEPDELEQLAPRSARLFDRQLTSGEIGSAASHLAAIREIAAGPDEFACVLEDDADFLSSDIVQFLDPANLRAVPSFDVLRLVSDPDRWNWPAWQISEIHGRGVYAMSRPGWGAQGQIFSREGPEDSGANQGRQSTDRLCALPRLPRRRPSSRRSPPRIDPTRSAAHPYRIAVAERYRLSAGARSVPSSKIDLHVLATAAKTPGRATLHSGMGHCGLARILMQWPPHALFK